MPYKTEFGISLTVDKGPPPIKQTGPLDHVDATSGERYTFEPDDANDPTDVTLQIQAPVDAEELRFCAIDADQFTYDDCGTKKPGVVVYPGGEESHIDRPQVYLRRPGQNLVNFAQFNIRVKKEVFSAVPKVIVTV